MEKRAVILAGGKGTRLKPYTIVLPKPLVPIHEYPVLELILCQLQRSGFTRITIAVNHMAELIMAYFGNGEKWHVDIDYSLENRPLSTMGPLRLIRDLPENFLVMNGDVLTDIDIPNLFDEHVASGNIFTIASHKRVMKSDYGVLDVDDKNLLIGFSEKPELNILVSMGLYIVNRRIIPKIPADTPFGFDNLMLKLLDEHEPVGVHPFEGYWLDIGRPEDYAQAIDEFDSIKSVFLG
jgi:NDP-mannose synthase